MSLCKKCFTFYGTIQGYCGDCAKEEGVMPVKKKKKKPKKKPKPVIVQKKKKDDSYLKEIAEEVKKLKEKGVYGEKYYVSYGESCEDVKEREGSHERYGLNLYYEIISEEEHKVKKSKKVIPKKQKWQNDASFDKYGKTCPVCGSDYILLDYHHNIDGYTCCEGDTVICENPKCGVHRVCLYDGWEEV